MLVPIVECPRHEHAAFVCVECHQAQIEALLAKIEDLQLELRDMRSANVQNNPMFDAKRS